MRNGLSSEKKRKLIKKSLVFSIFDGTFHSMMVGFGESFISAFAIFLKATNIQLGLLSSLPLLLGSLSQLFSIRLIKKFNSRKKFIVTSALLQAFMYIPIALVFFFGTLRVFHLIVFMCFYWIFFMVLNPAWNSWMGDLVSERHRGLYFGRRNRIIGFASFITTLLAGFILQRFADGEMTQYIGFVLIFSLALGSRVMSAFFLSKKYEPKYRPVEEKGLSVFSFIKRVKGSNFGVLILYLCLINFAVYMSAPFFAAYMLYDLKMSYMTFTIVNASLIISRFIFMPMWGRISDQFGSKKVLAVTGFTIPLIPILWVLNADVAYLIILQLFSGFVWSGFELISFNFVLDTTTHDNRATFVSYYSVLNGVAIFIGGVIGSIIVKYNNVFWSKYLWIFIVSGVLRYIIGILLIPRLRDVRSVDGIDYPHFFIKIVTNIPTVGIFFNMVTFRKKR
ncbi:MAG: MFS transporter [Nanoarchaeota archaeon]|nr:MFS transporter [Nanoarchaeota archaeon]MCG2717927.1 MFS transporter [Nanoarchaeota archaeon]